MHRPILPALAVLLAAPVWAESHLPQGDAAAGEQVFRQCRACHMVGEDAKNRVGPVLNGIVGRAAGSVEGFRYSRPLEQAGADGLIWTEDELHAFIEDPRGYLKGTRMSFRGIDDAQERADVIAYIAGFAEDGTPAETD